MRNYIIICLVSCLSVVLEAQDKSLSVEVSSDTILIGNYIEVTYILLNIEGEFKTPDFGNMKIVGGPNHSSSMSSINGDVRQQKSVSYYVEPLETGEYFIPPIYVKEAEVNWETSPLKVIVKTNPDGIINYPSRTQEFKFEFGDLFDHSDFFGRDELFPERKNEDGKPAKSKVKKRKI